MTSLIEKIRDYEKRMDRDKNIGMRMYPYEKKSVYEFISGSQSDVCRRDRVGLYRGRFIDVLVMAFEHPKFAGDWCGPDTWNVNNGYVKEYKAQEIQDVKPYYINIISDIKAARRLEGRIAKYESDLKEKNRR